MSGLRSVSALYLSYDGLTDPLGQSQVIPYIVGLAAEGCRIHVVSHEKRDRLEAGRGAVERVLADAGIMWYPQLYTKRPPVISTVRDVVRMRREAFRLHAMHRFDLVHCRSYVAALAGLALKERKGVRFLFDMRGFWPDERVDGGTWRLGNPLYRAIYLYFKRMESRFMASADAVVVLTEAALDEVRTWASFRESIAPVVVIPCSVDLDRFRVPSAEEKHASRWAIGIPDDVSPVVVYAGSLGTWYLADEMVELYAAIRSRYPAAHFLVITQDDPRPVLDRARLMGIPERSLTIRSASRQEMPGLLGAGDVGLSLIRPSYSKKASSPTKLGEYLAVGLPVITNGGVGDVDRIVNRTEGGVVLSGFSDVAYAEVVAELPRLLALDPRVLRDRAAEIYDLKRAVREYATLYQAVVVGRLGGASEP